MFCRQGSSVCVLYLLILHFQMSVYFDHAAAQLADCETVKIITDNLQKYGVPVVVAINRFDTDTDEELAALKTQFNI